MVISHGLTGQASSVGIDAGGNRLGFQGGRLQPPIRYLNPISKRCTSQGQSRSQGHRSTENAHDFPSTFKRLT